MGAWGRKVEAPAGGAVEQIMKSTPWSGTHKQSHCPVQPAGKSRLGEAIRDSTGLSGSTESVVPLSAPWLAPGRAAQPGQMLGAWYRGRVVGMTRPVHVRH